MLKSGKMDATNATNDKKQFLEALKRCAGNVSEAMNQVPTHRATHYRWLESDPEYAAAVDAIKESLIDRAEGVLHGLISEGNVPAVLFFLKTQGKKRGYVERTETDVTSGGQPIVFETKVIKTRELNADD
jgi:hypothetical protein